MSSFEPGVTHRLALLHLSLGDLSSAAAAFEGAALRSEHLGRRVLARELFVQARSADPTRPAPWLWLSEQARGAGDLELSARLLEQAVKVSEERGARDTADACMERLYEIRAELRLGQDDDDATVPFSRADIHFLLDALSAPSAVLNARPFSLEGAVEL